jgi:heat shock protein HslJ
MINKVFWVLSFLGFVLIAQLSVSAQSSLLSGRTWTLERVNGRDVGSTKASIEFDMSAGRFSGSGGCNRISGGVATDDGTIKFTGVASTRMACISKEATTTETEFLMALRTAGTYRISGDDLFINNGTKEVLKFTAESEAKTVADHVGIDEKKWMLESFGSEKIGKVEQQPFMVFDPVKGSVGGNTGCNLFTGTYTIKGTELKITKGISTMRACVEDRTNLEQRFSDALSDVDRYEIVGNRLSLYKGETLLMNFNGVKKQ